MVIVFKERGFWGDFSAIFDIFGELSFFNISVSPSYIKAILSLGLNMERGKKILPLLLTFKVIMYHHPSMALAMNNKFFYFKDNIINSGCQG